MLVNWNQQNWSQKLASCAIIRCYELNIPVTDLDKKIGEIPGYIFRLKNSDAQITILTVMKIENALHTGLFNWELYFSEIERIKRNENT